MKWHYDFGSVRTPKSKNEGNLSFLVIYVPSDSQRGATWSVPSTDAKRSSEEHHLLAFKSVSWWRTTHETGKMNKIGMTQFSKMCVVVYSAAKFPPQPKLISYLGIISINGWYSWPYRKKQLLKISRITVCRSPVYNCSHNTPQGLHLQRPVVVATEDCVITRCESSQVLTVWSLWTFPENIFWGLYKLWGKENVSKDFL